MENYSDFDAQFEQTLALVTGNGKGDAESQRDPNQFKPSVTDKNPEYTATVRFVPPTSGPMFVKKVVHFMKIGGKNVRVICPKTNDLPGQRQSHCDICSDNIQGHKSKNPDLVARAHAHGNKIRWVANVLVLEDARNPSNNGKVLWWEFPNSLMDMINALRNPPANMGIPSVNAFNPNSSVPFLLSMKMVGNQPKYDGSQFITLAGLSPLGDANAIAYYRSICHDIQSQIVIPSDAEIMDILTKANGAPVAGVQKTYANIPQGGHVQPQMTGFGSYQPQQAPPPDEFDMAFAQAGHAIPQAQAFGSQPQYAPAPQAPKPVMQVPVQQIPAQVPAPVAPVYQQVPVAQAPVQVAPPARVTPIPQAPAQAQPHATAPIDEDGWLKGG